MVDGFLVNGELILKIVVDFGLRKLAVFVCVTRREKGFVNCLVFCVEDRS